MNRRWRPDEPLIAKATSEAQPVAPGISVLGLLSSFCVSFLFMAAMFAMKGFSHPFATAGIFGLAVTLLMLSDSLVKSGRGYLAKGGCLTLVALAFAGSGAWLFIRNLNANRASQIPLFAWNTGFWVFWV